MCVCQIANINNCLSFGEYMRMLRRRYLKKDEYEEEGGEEETEIIRKDRFQQLTEQFDSIAYSWCAFFLFLVFLVKRDHHGCVHV